MILVLGVCSGEKQPIPTGVDTLQSLEWDAALLFSSTFFRKFSSRKEWLLLLSSTEAKRGSVESLWAICPDRLEGWVLGMSFNPDEVQPPLSPRKRTWRRDFCCRS